MNMITNQRLYTFQCIYMFYTTNSKQVSRNQFTQSINPNQINSNKSNKVNKKSNVTWNFHPSFFSKDWVCLNSIPIIIVIGERDRRMCFVIILVQRGDHPSYRIEVPFLFLDHLHLTQF